MCVLALKAGRDARSRNEAWCQQPEHWTPATDFCGTLSFLHNVWGRDIQCIYCGLYAGKGLDELGTRGSFWQYGGFLSHGVPPFIYPFITIYRWIFHYKPSILGYPHFRTSPYGNQSDSSLHRNVAAAHFSSVSSAYKASFHVCHQNICRKLKPNSKSPGIHSAGRDRQYAGGGQHLPLFRTQLLYAMQYIHVLI